MSADIVVHGIILGLVFGLLGVGVVLVHRASGVVNFAHGETGALGAAVLAKLVLDEHWPFVAALAAVLVVGAVVGAATDLLVARRLVTTPRLVVLVATIGLAQLLLVVHLLLPSIREVAPFPSAIHRHLAVGSVVLRGPDFLPIALVPAVVVGLWLWLTRTPSGLALRAVGDNRDAAELAGLGPSRVAVTAWALAGALSTLAAVLAAPIQGVVVGQPSEALGVGLLLRALAAALVGRLDSIPLALAGGLGVGLLQAVADGGHIDPAAADLLLLMFVVGVVLVRRRDTEAPAHARDRELAPVPRSSRLAPIAVVVIAAVPLAVRHSSQLFSLSRVMLYAVVGMSLVLLTGWSGQLSLGQFALVGVGTFSAAILERHGVPFLVTIPAAAIIGAAVSGALGLPALRLRGMELAVTTLALALACSGWLFTRPALLDRTGGATVTRATFARGPVAYYELCAAALAVSMLILGRVRRGRLGRRLLAVRSDERRAAALGVSPVVTKLLAFAVAGAFAAAAGALLGGLRVHSSPGDFGPGESLRIVAVTVIGGAGSITGALVGAAVVLGIPAVFGSTTIAGLLPSGAGLLGLTLVLPGGLAEAGRRLLLRRTPPPADAVGTPAPRPASAAAGELEVQDVTVRFGGRCALDGVGFRARPGEIVALIGANGAGKSTLLDVIAGFLIPQSGDVRLDDRSLARLRAPARARAGLGLVVQDSRGFDDLTVGELMQLAHGDAPAGPDAPCADLPAGRRRMLEVSAAMTRGPAVLLLDEPTAGLTAEEADRFEVMLRAATTTIVLVEHDLALVRRVADRIVCLEAGVVIADGMAVDVLSAPAVVAAVGRG